jgi:hypothetical protein
MAGFVTVELPSDARGNVDLEAVRAACDDTVAWRCGSAAWSVTAAAPRHDGARSNGYSRRRQGGRRDTPPTTAVALPLAAAACGALPPSPAAADVPWRRSQAAGRVRAPARRPSGLPAAAGGPSAPSESGGHQFRIVSTGMPDYPTLAVRADPLDPCCAESDRSRACRTSSLFRTMMCCCLLKTRLMQRSKCDANNCRWCPNQFGLLSRRSAGSNRRSSQRDFVAMPKACRRALR